MTKVAKIPDILAKISRLSPKDKIAFYAMVIIVLVVFADRVIVSSYFGVISDLDKQIQKKEFQIKTGLRVVSQGENIAAQSANYRSYLIKTATENEEFTSMLKVLDKLSPGKQGFDILVMSNNGIKKAGLAQKYLVTLNCEGSIEKIMEFMYNIETTKEKLFVVEKYELTPKSKDTSLAKCAMTISNFVLP